MPFMVDYHLEKMGMAAQDRFPGVWKVFGKPVTEQRQNGLTSRGEAARIIVERQGLLEEIYIDWKLIPVIGKDVRNSQCHFLFVFATFRAHGFRCKPRYCLEASETLTNHTPNGDN